MPMLILVQPRLIGETYPIVLYMGLVPLFEEQESVQILALTALLLSATSDSSGVDAKEKRKTRTTSKVVLKKSEGPSSSEGVSLPPHVISAINGMLIGDGSLVRPSAGPKAGAAFTIVAGTGKGEMAEAIYDLLKPYFHVELVVRERTVTYL